MDDLIDDDLSDFGDEAGLRRLVVKAIRRVREGNVAEHEKRGWIALIEEQARTGSVRDRSDAPQR